MPFRVLASGVTATVALFAPWMPSSPPPAASLTGCKAPSAVLSGPAKVTALPGGATMRVWDTGATPNHPQQATRIVAVRVPVSSPLRLHVRTTGNLHTSSTPATFTAARPAAVVTLNGSVFDPTQGTFPAAGVFAGGHTYKGSSKHDYVLARTADGKTAFAEMALTGSVTASGKTWPLTALNTGTLRADGVNAFTSAWGPGRHPAGTVELVVKDGKVTAVRSGSLRGAAVPAHSSAVTGSGPFAAALGQLKVGSAVTVRFHPDFTAVRTVTGWAQAPVAPVTDALGRGATLVRDGQPAVDCVAGSRNEESRPRTAAGWMPNGDLLLVTAQGRATVRGVRYGGATLRQMGIYVSRLGAAYATNLDGGGSTTMLVRSRQGASAVRVDRANVRDAQRRVPTALTLELP